MSAPAKLAPDATNADVLTPSLPDTPHTADHLAKALQLHTDVGAAAPDKAEQKLGPESVREWLDNQDNVQVRHVRFGVDQRTFDASKCTWHLEVNMSTVLTML